MLCVTLFQDIFRLFLLMATLATGGALLHIGMAPLAILMGIFLAEPVNLAGLFLMALLAVANRSRMCLVVKTNFFFHLDRFGGSGKSGPSEGDEDNQCNKCSFHTWLLCICFNITAELKFYTASGLCQHDE
jgi:hypothetical protein